MSASQTTRGIGRVRFWTWLHRATAAGFFALLCLASQPWFPWFRGSPTATRLIDAVPFMDPLAALEVFLAAGTLTWSMALGVLPPLLIAALCGRVFCGWLCPLGLVLELGDGIRVTLQRFAMKLGWRFPRLAIPRSTKYVLLALTLVMSAAASVPVFTALSPINLTVLAIWGAPVLAVAVIGGIWVLEWFAPRAFCRSLCSLGALYASVGRFALLRVRVREEGQQLMCGQCTVRCPMGIQVMEQYVLDGESAVDDPECTRCGTCADACGGHVLKLGFRKR